MLVDISTPRMSRMDLAMIELVPLTAGTEYVQAPVAANFYHWPKYRWLVG